jgi:hypothetical protein
MFDEITLSLMRSIFDCKSNASAFKDEEVNKINIILLRKGNV